MSLKKQTFKAFARTPRVQLRGGILDEFSPGQSLGGMQTPSHFSTTQSTLDNRSVPDWLASMPRLGASASGSGSGSGPGPSTIGNGPITPAILPTIQKLRGKEAPKSPLRKLGDVFGSVKSKVEAAFRRSMIKSSVADKQEPETPVGQGKKSRMDKGKGKSPGWGVGGWARPAEVIEEE
jgi:hypothetical protein